jgi:hypothetical protein
MRWFEESIQSDSVSEIRDGIDHYSPCQDPSHRLVAYIHERQIDRWHGQNIPRIPEIPF